MTKEENAKMILGAQYYGYIKYLIFSPKIKKKVATGDFMSNVGCIQITSPDGIFITSIDEMQIRLLTDAGYTDVVNEINRILNQQQNG